jgi:HlyD family secretion protein
MWDKAAAGAELADKTYQRLNALYKEGLVSLQRNDEAQTNSKAALDTALAAKAQYDTALSGARPQEKRAAGAAALQAAGGVAEVDAAALELVLKAPRAAHVDKLVLHAGELAGAGFPILTLVDLADIWVVFNIREDDFAGIKIGAVLDGKVPALGHQAVRFVIDTISPRGDYATWRATRQSSGYDVRTFEVRARPQAPVEGLRPGMSVLVEAR